MVVLNRSLLVGLVVVSIAIAGFAAGGFAGAYMAGGEPGTEFDPLVAESYLKEAVAEATEELQAEIIALQEEIEELRGKLDKLEAKAASSTGSIGASRSQSNSSGAKSSPEQAQPAITGVPKEPGKTGVVNTPSGANLRTGPGTGYERVLTVAYHTRVELVANMDGWYEVKLADGTKGWILGELIELD